MIAIGDGMVIENYQGLQTFIKTLDGEVYNNYTQQLINAITDYLYEVWDRIKRMEKAVQEKISKDIIPVAYVDIGLTKNIKDIYIGAVTKSENVDLKKRDQKLFNDLSEEYFRGMLCLYERLNRVEHDVQTQWSRKTEGYRIQQD